MLIDAPSVYNQEPEVTKLISDIPTVWDETMVLNAEFGKYIVEARRSADKWWVAGITGSQAKEIRIDCSFLDEGTFKAEIDFLIQTASQIIPAEVKSEKRVSGKSLSVYNKKFGPEVRIRFSLNNLQHENGLINIPVFLADWSKKIIAMN